MSPGDIRPEPNVARFGLETFRRMSPGDICAVARHSEKLVRALTFLHWFPLGNGVETFVAECRKRMSPMSPMSPAAANVSKPIFASEMHAFWYPHSDPSVVRKDCSELSEELPDGTWEPMSSWSLSQTTKHHLLGYFLGHRNSEQMPAPQPWPGDIRH